MKKLQNKKPLTIRKHVCLKLYLTVDRRGATISVKTAKSFPEQLNNFKHMTKKFTKNNFVK